MEQLHILTTGEMLSIGFRRTNGHWFYTKDLVNDISFNLRIYDNGAYDFYVLDDDFGQPYDYQRMKNPVAMKVAKLVEIEIEYLTNCGVIKEDN